MNYPSRVSVKAQFARFAVVGTIGFCVDVAVLYLCLRGFGLGVYSARLVSYFSAATATWYLNRRITFVGFERTKPFRQWLRFVSVNGFGGLVNYGVYGVIVTFGTALSLAPFLGVAAGSIAGLAFNFAASRIFVFRPRIPPKAAETPPSSLPWPKTGLEVVGGCGTAADERTL